MQVKTTETNQHEHIYRFSIKDKTQTIVFRSGFDAGNAKVVKQISDYSYRLQCLNDGRKHGKIINAKSWFFFSVEGFPHKAKGKFIISKVQALISLYYSKYSRYYRPVYRINHSSWQRMENQCELSLNQNGQVQCTIQFVFQQDHQCVEFAFGYPYQYQQNIRYLDGLEGLREDQEIYYHKEVLIESPEKRPIHLLTITNRLKNDMGQECEELYDNCVFPEKKRPLKFKKPAVLITARVHPGETPASYAMEGVINFLLKKDDLRAHLLRSMFVFMVVPMINVDGVFHGHFRMDIHGKNLNRFYIKPDIELQPAIYGIKSLAKHLISSNRLSFYFDLHGHNAKKGCFIYGNAFSQFVEQVESQVFCKLFAMNHSGFQYEYCNFSEKHMNAKDRFEDLTKEGCGRVVMHKEANIIHSYSLQCGIISANSVSTVPEPSNKSFKVGEKGFVSDNFEQNSNEGIKMADNSVLFTEESFRNLGKNLLVSILDVFDKNPYSRVNNSRYKSMEMLRRITAFEIFHSAERFRMFERSIFGKVKNINNLIQDIMSNKQQYKSLFNCQFYDDQRLFYVEWPKNIPGLCKSIKVEQTFKSKKIKSTLNEVKLAPKVEVQEEKNQKNLLAKEIQLSCIKLEEKHRGFQEEKKDEFDRTETIQIQDIKTEDIIIEKVENQKEQNFQPEQFPKKCSEHLMDFGKKISDLTVHEAEGEVDLDSQSDQSESKDAELNQQILLMCEDENEQNELITKIMHDNFNEKDYFQIEQKYKHKNQLEDEQQQQQQEVPKSEISVAPSRVESDHVKPLNNGSMIKQNKYRVNRKVIINTCDISHQYKKKNNSEHEVLSGKNHSEFASMKRPSPAEQFRKNIYDAIKQEIKEGLKKEYDKRKHRQKMNMKMIDSFKNKSTRAKSNQNYIDQKRMKSKVKLPSLGSNMYIITTSTRVLQKT